MAFKAGQIDDVELVVNNQFKTFSINLNVPHDNGMTRFDLATNSGKLVRLLDTVMY